MQVKLFEIFEKRLRDARCPEYFFGEITPSTLANYRSIRDKEYQHLEKIAENPHSANEKYRIHIARLLFFLLDSWACEKVKLGIYGIHTEYRLKILFEVRRFEGEKLHFYLVRNKALHCEKLSAALFGDGYLHADAVSVLREGVPIRSGYTREYGTHGATVCFHNIEENPTPWLDANNLREYDMVEINTWNYGSFDEFIRRFCL